MPPFSSAGYLLLGFTAFVGFLAGILGFAVVRVLSGSRESSRRMRESAADTAILSAALEEAVGKLRKPLRRRPGSARTAAPSKREHANLPAVRHGRDPRSEEGMRSEYRVSAARSKASKSRHGGEGQFNPLVILRG